MSAGRISASDEQPSLPRQLSARQQKLWQSATKASGIATGKASQLQQVLARSRLPSSQLGGIGFEDPGRIIAQVKNPENITIISREKLFQIAGAQKEPELRAKVESIYQQIERHIKGLAGAMKSEAPSTFHADAVQFIAGKGRLLLRAPHTERVGFFKSVEETYLVGVTGEDAISSIGKRMALAQERSDNAYLGVDISVLSDSEGVEEVTGLVSDESPSSLSSSPYYITRSDSSVFIESTPKRGMSPSSSFSPTQRQSEESISEVYGREEVTIDSTITGAIEARKTEMMKRKEGMAHEETICTYLVESLPKDAFEGLCRPIQVMNFADGRTSFLYQFAEGGNLAEKMESSSLSDLEKAEVLLDVMTGVQTLHDHLIIHRDIKPDNILFSEGRALVADFGISSHMTDPKLQVNLRQPPIFVAPEALKDMKASYTKESDVYSIGVLAYMILSDYQKPDSAWRHYSEQREEALRGEGQSAFIPVTDFSPIPEQFRALVQSMLDSDPSKRPDLETAKTILQNLLVHGA